MMDQYLGEQREQSDYEKDGSVEERELFEPTATPDAPVERWAVAFGYVAIGVSLLMMGLNLVFMAWQGEIHTFGLVDALAGWARIALALVGGLLVAVALMVGWRLRNLWRTKGPTAGDWDDEQTRDAHD